MTSQDAVYVQNVGYARSLYDEQYKEMFWSRVNKTDTCWLWTAGGCGRYGAFLSIRAHVYSYIIHFGFPPEGYHVHHGCLNKLCVRPEHLMALSPGEHSRLHHTAKRIRERENKIETGRGI